MPDSWAWCRLKDLFNVCSAKRVLQSEWQKEGVPFYRAREIVKLSNNGFVDNELFISLEHYEILKQSYGVPQVGDLMVTGVGTIGKVYIVKENDIFYYKDASVLCFENRYGTIISEFARIMIESPLLQEQIHSKTYGNTVDTITITTANEYLCALPPLPEQRRIIDKINIVSNVLSAIDNHIDKLSIDISNVKSKILDLAIRGKLVPQDPNDEPASVILERIRAEKEELIKQGKIKRDKKESVIFKGDDNSYYRLTADNKSNIIDIPFDIPDNWEWCNLSMIGSTNIGLTYKPVDIVADGTMVLRSSNIINGKIDLSDLVRVNSTIRENQYIQENDILICARNGSKALVGKCAIYENANEKASFGAFMAVYRSRFFKYVYYFLNSEFFRNTFSNDDSKQINQLTQDMIKNTTIPLPPFAEQKRIVTAIETAFAQLDEIANSIS
ncbi:restriction endonuclease subunit S [bacterium]|nr:restriction endonuclease subunit S [bacterium]